MKDYYSVLGVQRDATDEEIKKAYRKLAHEHHPDKTGGDAERFKEINEAYQILSDRKKRSEYDRFGSAGFGSGGFDPSSFDFSNFGSAGFGGFGDFGDIFETVFQSAGGVPREERGSDIEISLDITLEDVREEKRIPISFKTKVECLECSGLGYDKSKGVKKCSSCGGEGRVREIKRTILGSFSSVSVCKACSGKGEIPNEPCKKCSGDGRISGTREVEIRLPKAAKSGDAVRITGAGEAAKKGGRPGDLYVRITVKPHRIFVRRGDDLVITKEVSLKDFILGKKVEVPTISGKPAAVSIEPGSSIRKEIRVRGEGVTSSADLIVLLDIKAPKKLDKDIKKILEESDLG